MNDFGVVVFDHMFNLCQHQLMGIYTYILVRREEYSFLMNRNNGNFDEPEIYITKILIIQNMSKSFMWPPSVGRYL